MEQKSHQINSGGKCGDQCLCSMSSLAPEIVQAPLCGNCALRALGIWRERAKAEGAETKEMVLLYRIIPMEWADVSH